MAITLPAKAWSCQVPGYLQHSGDTILFPSMSANNTYFIVALWRSMVWKIFVFQVMDCRLLFGAKPLPETMLTYYQLEPYEDTSVNF